MRDVDVMASSVQIVAGTPMSSAVAASWRIRTVAITAYADTTTIVHKSSCRRDRLILQRSSMIAPVQAPVTPWPTMRMKSAMAIISTSHATYGPHGNQNGMPRQTAVMIETDAVCHGAQWRFGA